MTEEQVRSLPESFRGLFEQSGGDDIDLFGIAVQHVTTGVTVADARNPELPLVYVNPGFENVTGYAASEVIGKSCRFLQGGERDQPGLVLLRKALWNGESCTVRLRNFRKDGTLFHNELHISPVRNRAGELTHFVGIQLDVTDRVLARESLERSERQTRLALEREAELNEIKTRFISMVSHEFRTPMTGMHTSAILLRRFGDKLGREKMDRHLLNIEKSLKRMNRLLDDVLFFSRSDSDRIKVVVEPVEIGPYMEELLDNLKTIYPEREVMLENMIPQGETFDLDVHLLDHIFHNLIENAFKYSPPQSPVEMRMEKTREAITVRVTDHGIGIPQQDHAHLFEAFHRAGNVGTTQGTGLGLNIAQRAAELLGGKLNFTSEQGHGSSFVVEIPVK